MAEHPEKLIDALDHELWHHLLIHPGPKEWCENLWWEGATEFLAEEWRHQLGRADKRFALADGDVDYPVQTALVAAHYGKDPKGLVRFLVKGGSHELSLDAASLQARLPVVRERLRGWGWREDDGEPLRLSGLVQAEGDFPEVGMVKMIRSERILFRDFMRALAPEQFASLGSGSRREESFSRPIRLALREARRFAESPQQEFGK